MKTLLTNLFVLALLVATNARAAAPSVQDLINASTNEEQCLELAGDNESMQDQCMDMAY